MTQKSLSAEHIAKDKVWLIECRFNKTTDVVYGSAILIQSEQPNQTETTNSKEFYLLTCAHVLANKTGELADEILCWKPGTEFQDLNDLYDKSYPAVIFSEKKPFISGEYLTKHPEDDWALLNFKSYRPEINCSIATNWAAEIVPGESNRYTILGYFNGLEGILQKNRIISGRSRQKMIVQPDKAMANRIEETNSHSIVLKGAEKTQFGTSGGGIFNQLGKFYGMHRAASSTYDTRYALNSVYLKNSIEKTYFFPKTDHINTIEYSKYQPLIQLPIGILASLVIFCIGLSLYVLDKRFSNVFLSTSAFSSLLFLALCVIEWNVLVRPFADDGEPFKQRMTALRRNIFNQNSYRYLVSLYSNFLKKLFDENSMIGFVKAPSNPTSFNRYFTVVAFDRVLLLAFTYPLVAMMLTWCYFGDLGIGNVEALPTSADQSWNRYFMLFLLGISIILLTLPSLLASPNPIVRLVLAFTSGAVALSATVFFYRLTIDDVSGFNFNVPILLGSLLTITIMAGFSKLRVRESIAALVIAIVITNILLLIHGSISIEIDNSDIKAVYFEATSEAIIIAKANSPFNEWLNPQWIFIILLCTFALSLYYSMYILLSHIKKAEFSGFAAIFVGLSLSTPCTLALHSNHFNSIHVSLSFAIGLLVTDLVLRFSGVLVNRNPRIAAVFLYTFALCATVSLLICTGYFLSEIVIDSGKPHENYLGSNYASVTFLFVMCLLPLLNAPLDWISLSTTRALLDKILLEQNRSFVLLVAILDLVLACVFFLSVLCLLVVSYNLVNYALVFGSSLSSYTPLTNDMGSLVDILKANYSSANLWLWLLFATTLLPTTMHLLLSLFSLIGLLSIKDPKIIVETFQNFLAIAEQRAGQNYQDRAPFIRRFQAINYLLVLPALTLVSWLCISFFCLAAMVYAAGLLISTL